MFGPDFLGGFWPLMIYADGQLFPAAIGPVGQFVAYIVHQHVYLFIYAVGLTALFLLHGFLTPYFGIMGRAFTASLTITVTDPWLRCVVIKRVKVNSSIVFLAQS